MVIGQLLGLPIAFGSGQLSGAGFGPNYTILMKLGYEFYAPRILDEMQKNPQKSFEDTQYWRAFQKHLKSYTDKVLLQTIDSLAEFPKQTLDALQEKFGEFLSDSYTPSVSREGVSTLTSASNLGSQLVTIRLDLGQGFRREGEGSQKQGSSLFEKDLQSLREREEAKIRSGDVQRVAQAKKDVRQATIKSGVLDTKIITSKVVGATSPRRRTQSTDRELQILLATLVNQGKRLKAEQRGNIRAIIIKKIKVIQTKIQQHQNTYK